ncbi:MAG TPA: isoprenylcysteine carboxylmethyltransferase family protein [Acidimicrobiales bacterium]|nr:isoprenylcysteine carboxylmethyltransferase family protein [Acidimicrobiales bacterium]
MRSTGLNVDAARLVLDVVFVVSIGAEVWIRRSRPAHSGAPLDRDTRSWIGLSYLVGVFGGVLLAYQGVGPVIAHHNVTLFVVGVSLAFLGVALRLWAVHTLGRFFQLVLVVQSEHRVVTQGPYRVIRHPAYAGPVLGCLGIGLALDHWVSLVLCVVLPASAFIHRILVEEQMLVDGLGPEYERYRQRTKRLIPYVW